ncbi:MAG: hypothetical protein BGO14_08370 [Chlamydiales bacterium 38-26]|nr:DUF1543 domain-containing protein [Chlamydiales bacterium]OJV11004.1 MAG: hypothetical protein BGO14_08370 [Chlamydiales bacterium 38-26]
MDKKLFAVYLGGRAERCNIELHDVVFVIGESLKSTYEHLRKKWFGSLKNLHIDAYIHLQHVDGYEIHLSKDRMLQEDSAKKLYFINLGAYKGTDFMEYHQNVFYVSSSSAEAIKRAKSELCAGMDQVHKDDAILIKKASHSIDYDVDDIFELAQVDEYYISLKMCPDISNSIPVPKYIKLS